jgi:hypothetical protein
MADQQQPIQEKVVFLAPPAKGLNIYDNPLALGPEFASEYINFMPPTGSGITARPAMERLVNFDGIGKALVSYVTPAQRMPLPTGYFDIAVQYPSNSTLLCKVMLADGTCGLYEINAKSSPVTITYIDTINSDSYKSDYVVFMDSVYFADGKGERPYLFTHNKTLRHMIWYSPIGKPDDPNDAERLFVGDQVADLDSLAIYKNRLMGSQAGTCNIFHIPAVSANPKSVLDRDSDSVAKLFAVNSTGVFTLYGILNRGGSILKMFTIASGKQGEAQDFFCVITTNGELLVYSGSDPSDMEKWHLAGHYNLAVPLNANCICSIEGDTVIATANGFVSVKAIIAGGQGPLTEALEGRIATLFSKNQFRQQVFIDYMFLQYHSKRRLMMFNVPTRMSLKLDKVAEGYNIDQDTFLNFDPMIGGLDFDRQIKLFLASFLYKYAVDYTITYYLNNSMRSRIEVKFTNVSITQVTTSAGHKIQCETEVDFGVYVENPKNKMLTYTRFLAYPARYRCVDITVPYASMVISSIKKLAWNPSFYRGKIANNDSQIELITTTLPPPEPGLMKYNWQVTDVNATSKKFIDLTYSNLTSISEAYDSQIGGFNPFNTSSFELGFFPETWQQRVTPAMSAADLAAVPDEYDSNIDKLEFNVALGAIMDDEATVWLAPYLSPTGAEGQILYTVCEGPYDPLKPTNVLIQLYISELMLSWYIGPMGHVVGYTGTGPEAHYMFAKVRGIGYNPPNPPTVGDWSWNYHAPLSAIVDSAGPTDTVDRFDIRGNFMGGPTVYNRIMKNMLDRCLVDCVNNSVMAARWLDTNTFYQWLEQNFFFVVEKVDRSMPDHLYYGVSRVVSQILANLRNWAAAYKASLSSAAWNTWVQSHPHGTFSMKNSMSIRDMEGSESTEVSLPVELRVYTQFITAGQNQLTIKVMYFLYLGEYLLQGLLDGETLESHYTNFIHEPYYCCQWEVEYVCDYTASTFNPKRKEPVDGEDSPFHEICKKAWNSPKMSYRQIYQNSMDLLEEAGTSAGFPTGAGIESFATIFTRGLWFGDVKMARASDRQTWVQQLGWLYSSVIFRNNVGEQVSAANTNVDRSITTILPAVSCEQQYESSQYVLDVQRGTWAEWQDINMVSGIEHENEFYFIRMGNPKIFNGADIKYPVATSELCRFNSDLDGDFGSQPIMASYKTGFTDLGMPSLKKFTKCKVYGTASVFWGRYPYDLYYSIDFQDQVPVRYSGDSVEVSLRKPEILRVKPRTALKNQLNSVSYDEYAAQAKYLADYLSISSNVKWVNMMTVATQGTRIAIGSRFEITEHNVIVWGYDIHFIPLSSY